MSEHTSEKKNNSYYSSNNNRGHSYRGSSRGHPYRGGSRGYPQHSHRGPPPRNYNRNYHDDSKHNSRPFKNTVPSPDGDLRQSLPNRGTNSTINYASYNQPYQKRVIDLNPPNVGLLFFFSITFFLFGLKRKNSRRWPRYKYFF